MLTLVTIHAVGDLIVPPRQAIQFWRISPIEFLIFFASVVVTVFSTIEDGIYVSVSASVIILLYRIARPNGEFLGRVRIHAVAGGEPQMSSSVFVPLNNKNLNPGIYVEDPRPGVIVYRFQESFTYPNASMVNDRIIDFAKMKTRRARNTRYTSLGDRPWNEGYVPRSMDRILQMSDNDTRPLLAAVVYDFGGVSSIDSTGVQSLVDTRQQLDRYADREIEYHFAQIRSPWIKRALIAGGFGTGNPSRRIVEVASVVPLAETEVQVGVSKSIDDEESGHRKRKSATSKDMDVIESIEKIESENSSGIKGNMDFDVQPVLETNHPFFHLDLDAAVRAAEEAALRAGKKK